MLDNFKKALGMQTNTQKPLLSIPISELEEENTKVDNMTNETPEVEEKVIKTQFGNITGVFTKNGELVKAKGDVTVNQGFKAFNKEGEETAYEFPVTYEPIVVKQIGFQPKAITSIEPIIAYQQIKHNDKTFYTMTILQPRIINNKVEVAVIGGGGELFQTSVKVNYQEKEYEIKGQLMTVYDKGMIVGKFIPDMNQSMPFNIEEVLKANTDKLK